MAGDLEMEAFSTRVHTALETNGIKTLDDLAALSEEDVLHLPNVGRRSVQELKSFLALHGRTFRNARLSWHERERVSEVASLRARIAELEAEAARKRCPQCGGTGWLE